MPRIARGEARELDHRPDELRREIHRARGAHRIERCSDKARAKKQRPRKASRRDEGNMCRLAGQNDALATGNARLSQKEKTSRGNTCAVCEERRQQTKDLTAAEKQRGQWKKEAQDLQERIQRLEKECEGEEQRRDKPRGEARAVRETCDRLKKELQAVNAERERKVASAGQEKSSAEESSSSNMPNASSKKRKAKKQGKGDGAVKKLMTVKDMKAESVARGIGVQVVSRTNKDELQNMLVIGSTCITISDAWSQVLCLREKLKGERERALEEDVRRREALVLKEREEERKHQANMKEKRAAEIKSQLVHHTHDFPGVHGCKRAATKDLLFNGEPRVNACCDKCDMFAALFTCEKCDFDVCQACFKVMNMTPEEKKAEAKKQAAAAKREAAEAAKRRRLEEKAEKEAEEKRRKKWDPKRQFKSRIIDPLEKNFSLEGNKTKDFTVWCSDGYDNDGWHSYEGPPDKDFDTTYTRRRKMPTTGRGTCSTGKIPGGWGPTTSRSRRATRNPRGTGA